MASWTPELTETLRQLWADGHSGSVIGARIGKSRNSVIGRVSRLDLPSRKIVASFHSRRSKKSQPPRAEPTPVSPARQLIADGLQIPPPEETDIPRVATVDLEPHHCRWACGDPSEIGHAQPLFCGEPKVESLPYCGVHARRAYALPQPRRHVSNVITLPVKREPVLA